MAYKNLFHAQIGNGIYLISTDTQGKSLLPGKATTNSYLVVGNEKAMLFDLAVDDPDVKEYVASLTDKPIMLVLSHGHPDHIYHLNRWEEVTLHPADEKFLHGGLLGMKPVKPFPKLHFLNAGDQIDLGGRILDVIHIPGHTPGSILLLDRNSKILLSGDTGARRLLYGITDFVPFDMFCASLEELKDLDFEVMYSAHDRCALPKEHIDRMLSAIRNDLLHAKKVVPIPLVGKVRCLGIGDEMNLEYFDMAVLERKGGSHGTV